MKRLLVLAVLICTLTQCDSLRDAINQHDLQKVTVLLQHKKYDSASYVLYMNTAQEMVEKCRNDVLMENMKGSIDPVCASIGIALMFCSLYPVYKIYNIYMNNVINEKTGDIALEIAKFIGINFFTGTFFCTALFIGPCVVEAAYRQAIDIQQLILELPYE